MTKSHARPFDSDSDSDSDADLNRFALTMELSGARAKDLSLCNRNALPASAGVIC